ncbi:type IV pilus modification PilV family protein [Salinibius halmophilus]|uniref:type IV pilus modification PilV family protein n=1 Tax=Salinibius halmophilus TaxID=1853216 RepID=UPI000E66ABBF|nr:type II secretion system protein [Salinibius halmophilus]
MRNSRGATLIELVLIIVVLSGASLLLLQLTGQSNLQSAQTLVLNQSRAIASHTISEVMNKPVYDPDTFNCATIDTLPICPARAEAADQRASWDNVCDYNGYTGEPVAADGTSLGLAQYRVDIMVDDSASLNGSNTLGSDTSDPQPTLLNITVAVTDPTGSTLSLTGWRYALERWQCAN